MGPCHGCNPGFPSVGQKGAVALTRRSNPSKSPLHGKISSGSIQALFPQSPCIRSGQILCYHLLFSASFPLVAAQGNLLGKSCRGRVWCIFLARPQLFRLWLSHPARICRGSNARCFGKPPSTREASPLPAGEVYVHAEGCGHLAGDQCQGPRPQPCPGAGHSPGSAVCPGLGPGCRHHTFCSWLKIHWGRGERGTEVFALPVSMVTPW